MKAKPDWIQLGTNIAVVIGLILLVYELNQSRDLTRAQVVDAAYDAAVTRNLALMGESPESALAKSVFQPEALDETDAVVLAQFYTSLLVSWLRNKDERGLGYFERGFEQTIASEAYFIASAPGRTWWASVRPVTDPEIVEVVDAALAHQTVDDQRRMLEQMVGNAKAEWRTH